MYRTLKRSAIFSLLMMFVMASSSDQQAYELTGPTWPSHPVKYYVNTANADVDPDLVVPAIEDGALAWSVQSNADFAFEYDGSTAATAQGYNQKNEVIFRNASSGSAIATAYTWYSGDTILDSDIIFWDAAFQFFVGSSGRSGGFYVEDIAAHEFGHSAGIDHTPVSGATMYPSVSYCSTHPRSLASDDLDAIEALYPPASVPPTATPPSSLTARQGGDPLTSIDLTWQDDSEDETAFLVDRSTDGLSFSRVGTTLAEAETYLDTNLSHGTLYYCRVRATNSGGPSGPSNVASVTTDTPEAPAQPAAPVSPSPANNATGVDRGADLGWSDGGGAVTYDVYFGTENPPPPYRSGLTSPSLRLRKLSAGTTYYWMAYRVSQGVSSDSTLWQFETAGAGGGGSGPSGGGGGGNGNGNGNGKKK